MRLGGYQILDLENKDITKGVQMSEFYQNIYQSCNTPKRKVVSGLNLNGVNYDDFDAYMVKGTGVYTFSVDNYNISITPTQILATEKSTDDNI